MEKEDKELLPGDITPAQLNAWKAKYGKVFAIEVNVDEDGKDIATGYFKKPDLSVIGLVQKIGKEDPMKASISGFTNCWLGGDERFLSDDEIKLSAINEMGKLFKIRSARVKNL